jgi:hypothetical protein
MNNSGTIRFDYTGDSNYGSDPYGNGGGSFGNGYGQNPDLSSYQQQLNTWFQSAYTFYMSMQNGDPRKAMVAQELQQAQTYAQEYGFTLGAGTSGSWDPLSSPYGGYGSGSQYPSTNSMDPSANPIDPSSDPNAVAGVSGAQQSSAYSSPPDYQDSTKLVFETGTDWTYNASLNDGTDSRTPNVYTTNGHIIVNDSGAKVSVTQQTDPSTQKPMKVVTITYPDGTTRTVNFMGTNLYIQVPDPKSVVKDASVTSGVTVTQVGKDDTPQGDQPDSTDGTTRTWNTKDTVNYFATPGPETDEIYASSVNITLPDRTDTAEVTKTATNQYTVVIKDSTGQVVRTIQLYQVKNINFNSCDAANLYYADNTPGSTHTTLTQWTLPTCAQDPAITVNGQAEGATKVALDPNAPSDSIPTSFNSDGTTAIYNKDKDVTVTAYPDDTVTEHDISADGTVTINPNTQSDTASVSYDAQSGMLTIDITTKDQNGDTKHEIFKVDAKKANKILINMDPSNIVDGNKSGWDKNIPTDIAKKVFDNSGDAETAMAMDALSNNGAIKQLMKDGHFTNDQIQNALSDSGLTADDLKQLAVPPSSAMIQFLRDLDPSFDALLKNTDSLTSDPGNSKTRSAANDRLAELLSDLGYDAQRFTNNPYDHYLSNSQCDGIMMINGVPYNIFNDDSGKCDFSRWHFNPGEAHQEVDPQSGSPTGVWSWYDFKNKRWQADYDGHFTQQEVTNSHSPGNNYWVNQGDSYYQDQAGNNTRPNNPGYPNGFSDWPVY